MDNHPPDLFAADYLKVEHPPASEHEVIQHGTIITLPIPNHRRYWRDQLAAFTQHRMAFRPAWRGGQGHV